MATIYHVSPSGADTNPGTETSPFKTIFRAAAVARAGDTVRVHAGIYREWVRPFWGGTSPLQRITFEAAPDEHVVITGSEPVKQWEPVTKSVWKTFLPDSFFPYTNPFRELLWGDWFLDQGRKHHLGDIYLNGQSLYEVTSREEVLSPVPREDARYPERTLLQWTVEEEEEGVWLIANFADADPRHELVEVTVRPAVFFPEHTGINYITVRGFEIRHAATPWAPPTALQMGAVGPHWAKGWIIEDCHIHDIRCCGISLGKERATGQNEWSDGGKKHGTQTQRETVFKALLRGWSQENIGSHIVRRNHIHDCEQAGIVGHMGAIFSEITDNHIHDIYWKRAFTGHEMAGIKLHAPIDVLIARNRIHHCSQGLWMDWQAQGTRISANVLYENDWNDLHVEVSHGPYVVDNNIMLSPFSIRDVSQGGAYLYNLIAGWVKHFQVPNRFTHYHFPHSTAVLGMAMIAGGDDRYRNNIFTSREKITLSGTSSTSRRVDETTGDTKAQHTIGTATYDDCPLSFEEMEMGNKPHTWALAQLPVDIRDNWYGGNAQPFNRESNPVVDPESPLGIELMESPDELHIRLTVPPSLANTQVEEISPESLGVAFQPGAPFTNTDGSPLSTQTDLLGTRRSPSHSPGPFARLEEGIQTIKIWSSQKA